jgi:hypothetical protein
MSQYFEVTFLPPPGAYIGNAYAEIYIGGTNTAATVYSDIGLTSPITQPISISSGTLQCYFATGVVNATAIVSGNTYTIDTLGTTDFTLIGAASNTVGTTFVATGTGVGDGTAYFEYDIRIAGGNLARLLTITNIWTLPSSIWELNTNLWEEDPLSWGAVNPVSASVKTVNNIGQLYTANDLIRAAMRLIQVAAVDTDLTASELTDGLESLNRMVDSWSVDELMLYQVTREQFPLSSGENPYTIGYGGTWNTSRPTKIVDAYLTLNNGSIPVDYPMMVLNYDDYNAIRLKTLSTNFPGYIYYQPSFPIAEVYIYPIFSPNDPSTQGPAYITLTSWKPLEVFVDPTAPVSLPPGYWEAIVFNLAVRIAEEYQFDMRPTTVQLATAALKRIKRINQRTRTLQTDTALMNTSQMRYNIFSDSFGR